MIEKYLSFITEKVEAIITDSLKENLEKIEYLDKIEKGEVKCAICGKVIKLNNLSLIIEEEGDYKFICDDFKCYSEALDRWG